jgi:hypothetical protein
MLNTVTILKNAANKCGLTRNRFDDAQVPASMDNVCILPFFGDMRSLMIMSSLLLKRYREEVKGSKYFVLCSWPGFGDLFPYVNEYWSVNSDMFTHMSSTVGFNCSHMMTLERSLNYFFEEIIQTSDLTKFYDKGLTQDFLDRFKHIKCFKPVLPSSVVLGNDFNRLLAQREDRKVFLYPVKYIYKWGQGKLGKVKVGIDFWKQLVSFLLSNHFTPVVWNTALTYDLSPIFTGDCLYVTDNNIINVLSAMRATGCVLDVFSGISRYAILARCPYIVCDERTKYNDIKEYELDYLCGDKIYKEYIFSFAKLITSGYDGWQSSLFDVIKTKLENVYKNFDKDRLLATSESHEIVPYAMVKQLKKKKFGMRFIKIPHI